MWIFILSALLSSRALGFEVCNGGIIMAEEQNGMLCWWFALYLSLIENISDYSNLRIYFVVWFVSYCIGGDLRSSRQELTVPAGS